MNDKKPRGITFQPGIYDKVLELIPKDRAGRILDVGAGEGYLCRMLKDIGYRVEACDFQQENFKCPDVPFTKANLNSRIPFEDNSFDCVISVEVIEHIENHFQFVREMVRVAKPGGLVIITTPNILSLPSRLHFFLYGYTDCSPFPLDPSRKEYFMLHINPIGLSELIFYYEHCGAGLAQLTTNRIRKSAWIPMIILYPLLSLIIRLKFLRKKHADLHNLYRRHIHWMLHPANLMGRITIAVGKKINGEKD